MVLNYIIKETDINQNINEIISSNFNISSRLKTKLIKMKRIKINNEIIDTRKSANPNDTLTIDLNYDEDNSNVISTKMDLDIIYEDEWFLVVNKPAGIAIHPSLLHYTDSLSNGIKYYFDSINLKKKIRPVNRLDSNTSGIVIFAKCEYIQECFIKQMSEKTFKKEYLCFVEGNFNKEKFGTINLPIARKSGSIIERCIDKNGQNSITHYEVLDNFENYSLVECILETGRTHQIRVHMSYISHPLLGDTLYGTSSDLISRQALHSYKINLIHPITKESMSFSCDLPIDMQKLKQKFN